jgi:hypothetical protein
MKSVDQVDRLMAAIETYIIALVREALNVPLATMPASYRQETIEARARLIVVLGEFEQG